MPFVVPSSALDPAYDAAILAAISNQQFDHIYAPVTNTITDSSGTQHSGTFYLSADPIKIDGVRWGMGAKLMQQVADLIGAIFPTPLLRDLQWRQAALKIDPVTIGMLGRPLSDLSLTATMRAYSAAVDRSISNVGGIPKGGAAPSGKPWVLSNAILNHPGKADNFGWFVNTSANNWLGVPLYPADGDPALRMIQTEGFAHGLDQSDYSETPIFAYRWCVVDGVTRDIADIYRDPVLSKLVSHEGPLELVRQPGVPCQACATSAGSTILASKLALNVDTSGTTICPPPADSSLPPNSTSSSGSGSGSSSGGGLISSSFDDILKGVAVGGAIVGAGYVAYLGWRRYKRHGRLF